MPPHYQEKEGPRKVQRRNTGVTMIRSSWGARKPGVLTQGSWERRDQKTLLSVVLGTGETWARSCPGRGQCSQLISSLSGCALSELISFVERDNESVFRPMNLGRSGSDGLLPASSPLDPFCMLSTLSFSGEKSLLCYPIHMATAHPLGKPSFSLTLFRPVAV